MKKSKLKKQKQSPKKVKNPQRKKKIMRTIFEFVMIIIASLIYSIGFHCFTAPNNIAPGGASGIAVVVNNLTGLSVGLIYGLINLPLIVIGFIFLGKKLMAKTIISIIVITVATDFLYVNIPVYKGDLILAAIFGGFLMGAGLGLNYLCESTSGGTDIVNKILNKRLPHISLGKITFATDMAVIVFAMAVFQNIESGLYAIISMFVASKMVDILIYGSYEGKMMLIFSDKYDEISAKIMTTGRGVTYLKGEGAFSGEQKNVICCAVHKNEYVKVKRYVKEIDPAAFVVISNANEVLGQGFQEI